MKIPVLGAKAALVWAAVLVLSACVTITPSAPAVTTDTDAPLPLAPAMARLAGELLIQVPRSSRLALSDLLVGNRRLSLSDYLGGRLLDELVRQGRDHVRVLERSQLERALAETRFNPTLLSQAPQNIVNAGAFLPAEYLLVGSIRILDAWIEVQTRVFSVVDGTVVAAGTVRILRGPELDPLIPMLY